MVVVCISKQVVTHIGRFIVIIKFIYTEGKLSSVRQVNHKVCLTLTYHHLTVLVQVFCSVLTILYLISVTNDRQEEP